MGCIVAATLRKEEIVILEKSVVIVYHQVKPGVDCPDGICAAWIAARAFPGAGIEVVGDSYLSESEYLTADGYALPFSPEGRKVILVDFSYPKKVLEQILETAESLTVLDHHKSRLPDVSALSPRILGGCDLAECGATCAWKFFFPGIPQPWFLKYVWQRDTGADGYYEGLIPESEAIASALSARRRGLVGEAAFQMFEDLLSDSPEQLLVEGLPEIRRRDALVQAELQGWAGQTLLVGEQEVPWLVIQDPQCYKHLSVVGSRFAVRCEESPFVAVSTGEDRDGFSVSLRRRREGNADLAAIAQQLGGGGHERAAGFRLPVELTYPRETEPKSKMEQKFIERQNE